MRDFDLQCKDDNDQEMSATDYVLQKILVSNYTEGNQPPSSRDRAVSSVRGIFPQIKCLVIPSPGAGISNPTKKKFIDPDFHTSIDSARMHVVNNTPVKQGFNVSTVLNGPMLAALLDEYVQALNKPDAVPNLEISYQKVLDATLTKTTFEQAEKYHKQITKLFDKRLPLEEGDIEALKQTHFVRLEESLNGDILMTHKDPIATVEETDTLFGIHEKVYTHQLREFTIELHRLIPRAADTDEIIQKDQQTRKRQLLEKFEKLIIETNQRNVIIGGHVYQFTKINADKSESTCKEVFENIYKQQVQRVALKRELLKEKYYKLAVGPAKNKVFEEMISQIPGPPQNVNVNLEKQTLSWEKPLVSADNVNCYYVEWNRDGEDAKRDKVYINQFKLKELKPKTNYFIKVQGCKELHVNRLGEYCTSVPFETLAGKPEKPKMAKVSPLTEEKVKLAITMLSEAEQNGSPVTKIIVSRCSDNISTWESQDFFVDSSKGDFQKVEVYVNCKDNEETLYFRIQFENEAGVSEPSDSAPLQVADMIPGKPENIDIIPMARQIKINWNLPINNPRAVNNYLIQYWKEGESKLEKTVGNDEKFLQLTSLSPYTKYAVRFYARNEKNKRSSGYRILDVQTLADVPNKPNLPTIRVISASKATITFDRQKPNEENGSRVNKIVIEQQIRRNEQAATNWTGVKEHSLKNSDIEIVNFPVELVNLTEHAISCYRVVTVNKIGRSEPSQAVEVHPESIIPGSPEELEGISLQSDSITISWKKPSINTLALKRYQIQYKKANEDIWSVMYADVNKHLCNVSKCQPNTCYNFIVQALNEKLASEEATLNVSTPPSKPPQPKPPIAIPDGKEFTLRVKLPLIEESGREVTQLHVTYYNRKAEKLAEQPSVTREIKQKEDNQHTEQIQVNTDETHWISISLTNEVGRSDESELVGLSSDDVTPGIPEEFKCIPKARSVKLSWNVPKENGNAAKYYEVLIKCTEEQDWKTPTNLSAVDQTRHDKTLSYEATVSDLSPFTEYEFCVQAVNNNTCVGDPTTLKTKTNIAPPDKPLKPIAVEPIMGEPFRAKLHFEMLTKKQMNGSPVTSVIIKCESNEKTEHEEVFPVFEQQTKSPLTIVIPNLEDQIIKIYSFRIQMKNEEGKSQLSDTYKLPVSELQLGSPKNIKISDITAHTLKVQWEAPDIHPALVMCYEIECTDNQTSQKNKSESISANSDILEYTISKLHSSQKYDIKVFAVATKHSEPIHKSATTSKIYPGAPSSFFVDKISGNSVKVRWKKPKTNPEEVYFYMVRLMEGNCIKMAVPKVIEVRRTLGHSTVFKNLISWKTYTVSIDSYNDNMKTVENKTLQAVFDTKMGSGAKIFLQVVSLPTIGGPVSLGHTQKWAENMESSDDEFETDQTFLPSAPQKLKGEAQRSFWNNTLKLTWELPVQNAEELAYFNVQVTEKGGIKEINHSSKINALSETLYFDGSTKYCEISVTSFSCDNKKGPDATATFSLNV